MISYVYAMVPIIYIDLVTRLIKWQKKKEIQLYIRPTDICKLRVYFLYCYLFALNKRPIFTLGGR